MSYGTGRGREHEQHLGDIIPLVYRYAGDQSIFVVAKAGGLMLMFVDEMMITFEPSISLTDIVNAADTGRVSQLPHTFFNDANIVQEMVDRNFLDLWEWEWYNGRNRWRELKDRGGQVDPMWTDNIRKPVEEPHPCGER